MDKLWLDNNLDLQMVAYNIMETGYKVGYIEFVGDSIEMSSIHQRIGMFKGPFDEKSLYNYFKDEVIAKISPDQLPKVHENYIKSLAGQCVATYIVGIRDRHTGNYMI